MGFVTLNITIILHKIYCMLTKTTSRESGTTDASRRKFLGKIEGVAAFTALAAACQKDVNSSNQLSAGSEANALTRGSFGTGDIAIFIK